jgi:hypothetical protein
LASFAETKGSFTRWNLYASLGFDPNSPGGIGSLLHQLLQQKIDQSNHEMRRYQEEYEVAYRQIQYYQTRIRNAASEQEAKWIRAEHQSKANEFYTLEELRNKAHARAHQYANLFNGLIDLYHALFPRYFQEVYDPQMHQVTVGPFDDAPAGFRLLYKHGRDNPALWTLIFTPNEFVESLASFFIATENELVGAPIFSGIEEEAGQIVTAFVSHVRSIQFLQTSFDRMAIAHHKKPIENPLENLDKIEKKPWAYTSGGVIQTFLSCYFRRVEAPSEVSKWVESPLELLTFLVDTLKDLPDRDLERFIQSPQSSMLMHSPTHAFLLKPGWGSMRELWQSDQFTYTWVRDTAFLPAEAVVSQILLNHEMIRILLDEIQSVVPMSYRHYFKEVFKDLTRPILSIDFRAYILETLETTRGLQWMGEAVISAEVLDTVLFSMLPMCPSNQIVERVGTLIRQLSVYRAGMEENLIKILEERSPSHYRASYIGSKRLIEIALGVLQLLLKQCSSNVDLAKELVTIAREQKWLLPEPVIFADSNWARDHFAFAVNPGTGKLGFWRVDPLGLTGTPMLGWKIWLNGTRQSPQWGVFPKVFEYQG